MRFALFSVVKAIVSKNELLIQVLIEGHVLVSNRLYPQYHCRYLLERYA